MITVLQTNDGRFLITANNDLGALVDEAKKQGIEFSDEEDGWLDEITVHQETICDYVLIAPDCKFE